MAKIYEIRRNYTFRYGIDASHSAALRPLKCPVCGQWGTAGMAYPSIDPSSFPKDLQQYVTFRHRRQRREPLTLEEFEAARRRLAEIIGVDRPIEPGTKFGALNGTAYGVIPDLPWSGEYLLSRESVLSMMRRSGFDVIGVAAELKFRRKAHETLLEIEAPYTARLHASVLPDRCDACGRLGNLGDLVVDAASFDNSIPFQRILEWPTILLVSAEMVEYINENGLTGCVLEPVDTR